MTDCKLTEIIKDVRDSSGLVVALTGAGISAESGIPTFRGEEGYWIVGSRNYQPQELATYSAFCQMPEEIWAWYLYRRGVCHQAETNEAHHSIVNLEKSLRDRFILITQNVDGLHIRAGNSLEKTYQIHGNIDFMRCAKECTPQIYPIPEGVNAKAKGESLSAEELDLLRCPKCKNQARPHVLWFDECYDEEHFRFNSSINAAQECKLLLIIGTSGGTNLPVQVAHLASQNGAHIIDINPERNPFSDLGVWLEGSACQRLPKVVADLTD